MLYTVISTRFYIHLRGVVIMLKNLILACSYCDVCGEEKKTELICRKHTYTDELEDISITEESCWSICNECHSSLDQPLRELY